MSFVVVILFEMKMKKILLSFPFFILCVMLGFTSGVAADGEHSNCDDNGQSCDHSMPWWGWMLMLTVLVLTIVLVSCWCCNSGKASNLDAESRGSERRHRSRRRPRRARRPIVSSQPIRKKDVSTRSSPPPSYDEGSPTASTTTYSYR